MVAGDGAPPFLADCHDATPQQGDGAGQRQGKKIFTGFLRVKKYYVSHTFACWFTQMYYNFLTRTATDVLNLTSPLDDSL